ncbi:YjbQ family protein [bacterium]|nr:MAG: YjbQ family protein [bacterium]
MKVFNQTLTIETKGFSHIIDITNQLESAVEESGIENGIALVFVPGSTGGVTTIEYEPGLLKDFPELMEKLIPSNRSYHHDQTWHDGNGFSHLRSSLIGTSLVLPIYRGSVIHGTWQQVVIVDFDNRPRRRNVVIHLLGE